jgi:hypothetical protein
MTREEFASSFLSPEGKKQAFSFSLRQGEAQLLLKLGRKLHGKINEQFFFSTGISPKC